MAYLVHGSGARVEAQEFADSRLVGLIIVGELFGEFPRRCWCLSVYEVYRESVRVGQRDHVSSSRGVSEFHDSTGRWQLCCSTLTINTQDHSDKQGPIYFSKS